MNSRVSFQAAATILLSCIFTFWAIDGWAAAKGRAPENLFANASFEDGRDLWQLDHAGKTTATFRVDDKDAAAGQRSAVLSVGDVEQWGIQFGQTMEAPAAGKTYTFAVLAKGTKGPATIRLEIERRGGAYDRAAASPPQTLSKEAWTELHVTFKVDKPYPEGWFAYVSCHQPNVEFRLDMFRLYVGEYVAFEKVARTAAASAAVSLFDTLSASPGPLAGEAIAKRSGWSKVPEDQTDYKFTGDAVVANDRLAMVLRRGGPGAEVYCLGGDRATLRAVLTPDADKPVGDVRSTGFSRNSGETPPKGGTTSSIETPPKGGTTSSIERPPKGGTTSSIERPPKGGTTSSIEKPPKGGTTSSIERPPKGGTTSSIERPPKGGTTSSIEKPPKGGTTSSITSIAIAANGPGEVALDGAFQSNGKGIGVRYELAMGQPFVKTEPRDGTTALWVEAPCRHIVLPDFFADDIVIDAAELSVTRAELPSENFLLHLLPERDAVVMTVASNRTQDARIELASRRSGNSGSISATASGAEVGQINRSQMFYGAGGKIWVAVLQGANIWHACDVGKEQTGKVMGLDWKAPFVAQWRVDWRLANKLTGSWEMLSQLQNGRFMKHGWFGSPNILPPDRKHWTTVLGSFQFPCWIDREGRGWLQPMSRPERFQGPALIYPINRLRETPLDEFTVVDLVRATLGVGPCEYILDVEAQGTTMRGRATCSTRDTLGAIYGAKQQKGRRAEIEKVLTDVVIFVKHIRGRIEQYVTFGHETLAYIDQQKQAHPEAADFLAEMDASARAIDAAYAKRKAKIKTPQDVIDLTEKFRKTLLDYEGDDALKQCNAITFAIVDVGGNQDELVGECRAAVKVLRQRAGLAMATNPAAAEIAREIRDRTQKILRNALSYESPRH